MIAEVVQIFFNLLLRHWINLDLNDPRIERNKEPPAVWVMNDKILVAQLVGCNLDRTCRAFRLYSACKLDLGTAVLIEQYCDRACTAPGIEDRIVGEVELWPKERLARKAERTRRQNQNECQNFELRPINAEKSVKHGARKRTRLNA